MIKINLLPLDGKGRAVPTWWKDLPWKKMAIGAAGVLAVWSVWVLVAAQNQTRSLARLRMEWETLQPERIKLDQRQAMLQALRNREAILRSLKAPEGRWASRLNFLSDAVVSDLWFTLLNFSGGTTLEFGDFFAQEMQNLQLPGMESPGVSKGSNAGTAPAAAGGGRTRRLGAPAASLGDRPPALVLAGSALVSGKGTGAPVSRFLQKLKEHPEFGRWFSGVELKGIRHRQVKSEEMSDFVIFLFPTAGT